MRRATFPSHRFIENRPLWTTISSARKTDLRRVDCYVARVYLSEGRTRVARKSTIMGIARANNGNFTARRFPDQPANPMTTLSSRCSVLFYFSRMPYPCILHRRTKACREFASSLGHDDIESARDFLCSLSRIPLWFNKFCLLGETREIPSPLHRVSCALRIKIVLISTGVVVSPKHRSTSHRLSSIDRPRNLAATSTHGWNNRGETRRNSKQRNGSFSSREFDETYGITRPETVNVSFG